MDRTLIHNDPRLNDLIFQLCDSSEVIDRNTGVKIPGMDKREFLLSVPYRVGEILVLARPQAQFGGREFFYQWPAMTGDVAEKLARQYLENQKEKLKGNLFGVTFTQITPALYKKSQPCLGKGSPLNAFLAVGVMYLTDVDAAKQTQYYKVR